jgi:hypothetical protein
MSKASPSSGAKARLSLKLLRKRKRKQNNNVEIKTRVKKEEKMEGERRVKSAAKEEGLELWHYGDSHGAEMNVFCPRTLAEIGYQF